MISISLKKLCEKDFFSKDEIIDFCKKNTFSEEDWKYLEVNFLTSIKYASIILPYCITKNNLEKIIYFSKYALKNGYENLSMRLFINYLFEFPTKENLIKCEELDYPFIHYALGNYYMSLKTTDDVSKIRENIFKAKKCFEKGMRQESYYCACLAYDANIRCEKLGIIEKNLEKDLHYANQCLKLEKNNSHFNQFSDETLLYAEDILDISFQQNDIEYIFNELERSEITKNDKEKYLNIITNLPEISTYYGDFLEKNNRISEAKRYYRNAIEKGYVDAYKQLSRLHYNQNDYEKTIYYYDCYEKITNKVKDTADELQYKLVILKRIIFETDEVELLKKYESFFSNLFKSDLVSVEVLIRLGDKYERQSQFEKAIYYYEKAIEKGCEISKIFYCKDTENDEHYKRIKDGKKIIFTKDLKELTIENLNSLSEDSLIYVGTNFLPYKGLSCLNLYNISDMKKIIKIINNLLQDIDLNQKEEDIFMQIYIKLSHLIQYDYEAKNDGKFCKERISSSRNLMVLLNKKGVCTGYARVLETLLQIVGIKCRYIASKKMYSEEDKQELGHAYNKVQIDGKWYYCDLTWDSNAVILGRNCLQSELVFSRTQFHEDELFDRTYFEVSANPELRYKCTCSVDDIEEKAIYHYMNYEYLCFMNYVKLFKSGIGLLKNKIQEQLLQRVVPANIKDGGKVK